MKQLTRKLRIFVEYCIQDERMARLSGKMYKLGMLLSDDQEYLVKHSGWSNEYMSRSLRDVHNIILERIREESEVLIQGDFTTDLTTQHDEM